MQHPIFEPYELEKLEKSRKLIIKIKQELTKMDETELVYSIYSTTYNKFIEVLDLLRWISIIESTDNVRYTGITEVDYLLGAIQMHRREEIPNSIPTRDVIDENDVYFWIRDNYIPVRTRINDIDGQLFSVTAYTPDNFLHYIFVAMTSLAIDRYETALNIWNDYNTFSKINALAKQPEHLLDSETDSLVLLYKKVKRSISKKGAHLPEFDIVINHPGANTLLTSPRTTDLRNTDEVLLLKHLIKARFEKIMKDNDVIHISTDLFDLSITATYIKKHIRFILAAKSDHELKDYATGLLSYLNRIGAITTITVMHLVEEKMVEQERYDYHLTYSPIDQLAILAIEENLFGPLARCNDVNAEIRSKRFKPDNDKPYSEADYSFDLDSFKSRISASFLTT